MDLDRPLDDFVKDSLRAKRNERAARRKAAKRVPASAKSEGTQQTAAPQNGDVGARDAVGRLSTSKRGSGAIGKKRRQKKKTFASNAEQDLPRKLHTSVKTAPVRREPVPHLLPSNLPKSRTKAVKVAVSNLHPDVTQNDIAELFGTVGHLRSALLARYANGASTGEAEVIFENMPDALEAIKKYNEVPLDNQPLHITLVTTRTANRNGKARRGMPQKNVGRDDNKSPYDDQVESPENSNSFQEGNSPAAVRNNGNQHGGGAGGTRGNRQRRRRRNFNNRGAGNTGGGNDREERGNRDLYVD